MDPSAHSLIEGRAAFQAAVRAALVGAAAEGWRELWLCDASFADWPLGERGVVESLTRWGGVQRHLTLLASQFDDVVRRHSRWVQWRRQWSHLVTCRIVEEIEPVNVPALLWSPGALTLRLLDPVRFRGVVSRDAADGLEAKEIFDAITQRSVLGFATTTLGL